MDKNSKTDDKSKKTETLQKTDQKKNIDNNTKTKSSNESPIKPLTEKGKRLSLKYDLKFQDLRIKENRMRIAKETYLKNKRGGLLSKIFFRPIYEEETLNDNCVDDIKNNDNDLKKVMHVLTKSYHNRSSKDNEILLNFLLKTKIYEIIKNDLIETELSINELFDIFKDYISGRVYNFHDTVYYAGEESDKLYLILKGNISQFKLVLHEESLTSEEYYLFLYYNYVRCEELKQKIFNDFNYDDEEFQEYIEQSKNNNINNKSHINITEKKDANEILFLKEDEYADDFLLYHISEENKEMFPLKSFDDIEKLNKILLKIKLYSLLIENSSNSINIIDYYIKYNVPLSFLNYKKVLDNKMTENVFLKKVTDSIQKTERFYMRFMSQIKQKVKLSKYVRVNEITPYNYFGNFEIINCDPVRDYTMKCECDECILLTIHKKMYSAILFEKQKVKRENEINNFHTNYIFKNISYNYFVQKIFSLFEIRNFFKGDSIFTQKKNCDSFVFIKEGIIEISLDNISFIDLNLLIKKTKEVIHKKAKDYSMNINEIIDFDTNIDLKINIPYKLIKESLLQIQNFIFSRSEGGFFGDYEFFFNISSLITGKVFSDNCVAYFFSYDKYRCLTEETYILNESLKYSSFNKMKTILKRMVNVYHSYWKLNYNQIIKEIEDNENLIKNTMEKHLSPDDNLFNVNKKQLLRTAKINSPDYNPLLKSIKNYIKDGGKSDSEGGNDILNLYLNNSNTLNSKIFKTGLDVKKNKNLKTQENNINAKIRAMKKKMIDKEILLKKKININVGKIYKNDDINNKNEKKIYEPDFIPINKYQKNLLTGFKNIMDSQKKKERKYYKKVFLPPIMNIPNKLYEYKLFSRRSNNIANINLNAELNQPEVKDRYESFSYDRSQEKSRSSKKYPSYNKHRSRKFISVDFKYAQLNIMKLSNYRRLMIRSQNLNENSLNKSLDEKNY